MHGLHSVRTEKCINILEIDGLPHRGMDPIRLADEVIVISSDDDACCMGCPAACPLISSDDDACCMGCPAASPWLWLVDEV